MKQLLTLLTYLVGATLSAQSFATPVVIGNPEAAASQQQAGLPVDFNEDGLLDYLYTENPQFSNRLYVLLQQNDGTFARTQLSENEVAILIDFQDYNNDGFRDLLTIEGIFTNNGNNEFSFDNLLSIPFLDIPIGIKGSSLEGRPLYFSFNSQTAFDGEYSFGSSDGPGTNTATNVTFVREATSSGATILADVTGDERVEIITAGRDRADVITVLLEVNDFTAQTINEVAVDDNEVAVMDFDEDGDQDILLTGQFNGIYLWEQVTGETFQFNNDPVIDVERVFDIEVFDVDADGDQDIVTLGGGQSLEVLLHVNLGAGIFAAPVELYDTTPGLNAFFSYANALENSLAVGDFNNDEKPDLVLFIADNNEVLLLENTSVPSSVNEGKAALDLAVYPNPATGFFRIDTPENELWLNVSLSDLSGRKIRSWTEPTNHNFNLSGLPAGSYYISAISQSGQFYRATFVKE